jgi:hypothetical protein
MTNISSPFDIPEALETVIVVAPAEAVELREVLTEST